MDLPLHILRAQGTLNRDLRSTRSVRILVVAACVMALPATAYANPMIPSCGLYEPFALLLLPFVIFVEARILRHALELEPARARKLSFGMNVESTLAGVVFGLPLMFAAAFAGGAMESIAANETLKAYVEAIGFVHHNHLSEGHHLAAWAGLTTQALGYFALALWLERRYLARHLPELDVDDAYRSIKLCNATTYALMWLGASAWLLSST